MTSKKTMRHEPNQRATMDERDTFDLMRSIAAGALSGGLTFVRAKIGEAEFARALAQVRLREPIVRMIGPPAVPEAVNDERAIVAPPPPAVAPAPPPEPSRFLDEKQLCAELNISSVTATKWRRNAEGPPFVRVGRLIRYPRATFDGWLASRTVGIPRSK